MQAATRDVKAVIFDFGGVILNIAHKRTEEAFSRLGIENFVALYSQAMQVSLFDKLEKGLIAPTAFYDTIRQISGTAIPDRDLENAWNALLGDIPSSRIALLLKLKSRYRTFLLSNTNAIHYAVYHEQLRIIHGFNDFNELFERAYFSFQMGMKKPDAEIFERVLAENALDPATTLFIDDSILHIRGAAACGLQTRFLAPGEALTALFCPDTLDFLPG